MVHVSGTYYRTSNNVVLVLYASRNYTPSYEANPVQSNGCTSKGSNLASRDSAVKGYTNRIEGIFDTHLDDIDVYINKPSKEVTDPVDNPTNLVSNPTKNYPS